MKEDIEVPSIRDRDLRTILSHYGLDVAVDEGRLFCRACSCKITWENLGALLVQHDGLVLYCDLSECMDSASQSRSEPSGLDT